MPALCLFCDNNSGSREHLWPAWIHQRKDFGPLRHQIGAMPARILNDPQQKVRTVCGICNNGWMSTLEASNIPHMGLMLQDIAIPLDAAQQRLVSAWTTKTAMVFDSLKGRDPAKRFFTKEECVNLRLSYSIPDRTRIWVGRVSFSSLGGYGTDVKIVSPEGMSLAVGMAVTIVIGHLAIQSVTMHINPEHAGKDISDVQPKEAEWSQLLTPVWPPDLQYVPWPPKQSFEKSGRHGVGSLMERWRIGQAVPWN